VPRPGARLEVQDVRGWASARRACFKVPEVMEVLDVLPQNPKGKVMKALLRLSA
jgi:acyl-CoA synthetase (AMP-forming)/AMP-acid ligase II